MEEERAFTLSPLSELFVTMNVITTTKTKTTTRKMLGKAFSLKRYFILSSPLYFASSFPSLVFDSLTNSIILIQASGLLQEQ